jgi:MarR family transcriptional regulator, 2-MHQ and catechol-resistance regulon repressor
MAASKAESETEQTLSSYLALVRATESVLALLRRQLMSFDLSMSQFQALEALLHLGPMSQKLLGEKLLCGESNMTVVTGNLEARGLVIRKGHEKDRRKVVVHLTPEGQKLIAKVFPLHVKVIRAQMSALNARERDTLRRLCTKLGHGNPMKFLLEMSRFDSDEVEEN